MKKRGLTAAVYAFQTPLIFHEWLDEQQNRWSFRTAWVISDLRPAYTWMNDPQSRTNYPLAWRSAKLIHRFKQRLQSRKEQVFVIDRAGAPVLILEIVPVERTDMPLYAPLQVEGWSIYYLMPVAQQWDYTCSLYAREILRAVKGGQALPVLNIEIPLHAIELKKMVTEFGFVQIGSYINSSGPVELYRV